MNYKLTQEQEIEFEKVVKKMRDKINLALYKCDINKKDYADFYNYALEGLLVSYLILKKGEITDQDFEKYSFVTMKRKIIDELRRRNKNKYVCIEQIENLKIFEDKDYNITKIDFYESLKNCLTKDEKIMLNLLLKEENRSVIFKKMKISKSTGYNLINSIRDKCYTLVYNF